MQVLHKLAHKMQVGSQLLTMYVK